MPNKDYVRKPSAGRPPKPARQVFEDIVYVLRTGGQWKAWPADRFGSASAIHKRFLEWEKAGFFGRPSVCQVTIWVWLTSLRRWLIKEKTSRTMYLLRHRVASSLE